MEKSPTLWLSEISLIWIVMALIYIKEIAFDMKQSL